MILSRSVLSPLGECSFLDVDCWRFHGNLYFSLSCFFSFQEQNPSSSKAGEKNKRKTDAPSPLPPEDKNQEKEVKKNLIEVLRKNVGRHDVDETSCHRN